VLHLSYFQAYFYHQDQKKDFCEKKIVNVSICKCNIKSKKNTYYARVCKTGKVGVEELLAKLKSEAPYIDINMMRAGMEKIGNIIAEFVAIGTDVEFFNLGTLSLVSEGAIEVNPSMQSYLDDGDAESENADFDVSEALLKKPKFSLKFEPSSKCKKVCQNVEMGLALKKRRAPIIEKIENVVPAKICNAVNILRLKGDNLKIVGENEKIGVYLKEENGKEIKIDKENILQNTPKMLLILLGGKLKNNVSYTLSIFTQYACMGSTSTTSILREGKLKFNIEVKNNIAPIYEKTKWKRSIKPLSLNKERLKDIETLAA